MITGPQSIPPQSFLALAGVVALFHPRSFFAFRRTSMTSSPAPAPAPVIWVVSPEEAAADREANQKQQDVLLAYLAMVSTNGIDLANRIADDASSTVRCQFLRELTGRDEQIVEAAGTGETIVSRLCALLRGAAHRHQRLPRVAQVRIANRRQVHRPEDQLAEREPGAVLANGQSDQ